jgi:hypothetical protein
MKSWTLSLALVFSVLFQSQNSMADFREDNVKSSIKMQHEIIALYDYKEEVILDKELLIVLQEVKKAKTITEINTLFNTWLSRYDERRNMDRSFMTREDLKNFVFALGSWAYIYEACLQSLSIYQYDASSIETAIANNIFLYNGSYLRNYLAWVRSLDSASQESFNILNKESQSWLNKAKDFGRLMNPDYWAAGMPPRDAVKAIKPYESINVNYHPDEWYYIIRQYIEMQNTYYQFSDRRKKILKIYSSLTNIPSANIEEHRDNLYRFDKFNQLQDLFFKKVDSLVRYNYFDVPVQQLSWYSYLRCKEAQHWLDDKDKMTKALVDFASIKEFKYTADPVTDDILIRTRKAFKRNYSDEEYKEAEAQVKIKKEWYDLLPQVKEPKPDAKFE